MTAPEARHGSVLVATWGFPPYADVSALRAAKFCKYLPRSGWWPIVYTVAPEHYGDRRVATVLSELDATEVHRFPPLALPGSRFLVKLLFPVFVALFALRHRSRVRVAYIDAGPFHPLVVVPFLKLVLGIPVIVDLRDSWSTSTMVDATVPGWLRAPWRGLRHAIEWCGIRFAARVVCATRALEAEYRRAFPRHADRFVTIPNGYDPEELEAVQPAPATEERTIAMTGKFLFYTPEVARALLELLRSSLDLTLVYAGPEAGRLSRMAEAAGVASRVRTHDYLPREQMLALIAGSDFGLTTTALVNGLGTKIFDYLGLGKPTLCFVPPGSIIGEVFRDSPSVVIREAPHTPESVSDGFRTLLAIREFQPGPELAGFDRRDAAARLSELLVEAGNSLPRRA